MRTENVFNGAQLTEINQQRLTFKVWILNLRCIELKGCAWVISKVFNERITIQLKFFLCLASLPEFPRNSRGSRPPTSACSSIWSRTINNTSIAIINRLTKLADGDEWQPHERKTLNSIRSTLDVFPKNFPLKFNRRSCSSGEIAKYGKRGNLLWQIAISLLTQEGKEKQSGEGKRVRHFSCVSQSWENDLCNGNWVSGRMKWAFNSLNHSRRWWSSWRPANSQLKRPKH